MRDLFVFVVVVLLLPSAFRRPFIGLLLFSWLAYMRPQDLCWGFARSMRFSFLAAAAVFCGYFAYEAGKRAFTRWDVRTRCMLALMVFMTCSLLLAQDKGRYVMRYYFEFVKIIAVSLFTVGQLTDRRRLRLLLWVICVSLAFYGFKGGLFGVLTGGGRILRGPGGMLEDNNDFALALVMNLPLLFYLGQSEKQRWIKLGCMVAMLLTMVTILLTHSRGAAVAMIGMILVMAWRSGNLIKALVVLGLGVAAFFAFAPDHVIERLATLKQGTAEGSAGTRIRAWTVALRMIENNPVLGVGIRNFQVHWARNAYDLPGGGNFAYVAHNSYLQIWAEGGTLAFGVYMTMLFSSLLACRFLRKVARARPDLAWAGPYGRMMEASVVGFMIGSFFLNRGHFDLIYHFVALTSAMVFVARSELAAARVPAGEEAAARAGPARVVVARPRLSPGGLPRWGRSW